MWFVPAQATLSAFPERSINNQIFDRDVPL
jgi:hypothetical protein